MAARKGLAALIIIVALTASLVMTAATFHGSTSAPKTPTSATASEEMQQYAVSGAPTNPVPFVKWNSMTDGHVDNTLTVADVNSDGKMEVIVGTDYGTLYCLNGTTGSKLWSFGASWGIYYAPVVADLLGNGKQEVVFPSDRLYCLNGTSGQKLWSLALPNGVASSPIATDLLGNGKKELVVGSSYDIYCLSGSNGGTLWDFATGGLITSPPISADLLGNGKREVIVGSFDNTTYCSNGTTGSELWSYRTGNMISSSPLAADFLGNGEKEVIVRPTNSDVYCLNATNGNRLWSYYSPSISYPTPTVADVDGDGKPEILVGSSINRVSCLNVALMPSCRLTFLVEDTSGPVQGAIAASVSQPLGQPTLVGYTDRNGSVIFDPTLLGNYSVTVSRNGYYNYTMSLVVSAPNQNYSIHVYLTSISGGGTTNLVLVLSALGMAALAIISALLVVVRRRGQAQRSTSTSQLDEDDTLVHRETWPAEIDEGIAPPSLKTCPYCGVRLATNASYCQNCGASMGILPGSAAVSNQAQRPILLVQMCMICKLKIREGDDVVQCPYCGYKAHRTHMLEWLHVKDYCPVCHRHLDEHDFE